jgi:hypothetical protein
MDGHLLLTLVDHAKPFKGTWQIFQAHDDRYLACHSPSPLAQSSELSSCQAFTSNKRVCQFTELLQFYGWSIAGQSPQSLHFRQGCAL